MTANDLRPAPPPHTPHPAPPATHPSPCPPRHTPLTQPPPPDTPHPVPPAIHPSPCPPHFPPTSLCLEALSNPPPLPPSSPTFQHTSALRPQSSATPDSRCGRRSDSARGSAGSLRL